MADQTDVIQMMIREMIRKELTLTAVGHWKDTVELQLELSGEPIGKPVYVKLDTDADHRHNCDHVTDVDLYVTENPFD